MLIEYPYLFTDVFNAFCQVGTANQTGKPYYSSYDIWTQNCISYLVDDTIEAFAPHSTEPSIVGWVNSDKYEDTSETFGILPLTLSTRTKLGMQPFHSQYANDMKIQHYHLAKLQGTRVAMLPIHTSAERSMFCLMIKDHSETKCFGAQEQPNWVAFAQEWAACSDRIQIFYKVSVCLPFQYIQITLTYFYGSFQSTSRYTINNGLSIGTKKTQ